MPVVAHGKAVVEKSTGRVVAKAKSKRKARVYAAIRNRKHAEKMEREGK